MKRKNKKKITVDENGIPYEECLWTTSDGYTIARLINNEGECEDIALHYIMASTFHPNPDNYEHVHFKDGDITNCHADNLEWAKLPQIFN